MGSVLFKVWGNLPSRVIGIAGIFLPAYFAANPNDFNKAVGAVMGPENIRFWSLVVLGLFVVYWVVYWYLKRREDGMGKDGNDDDDKGGGGGTTHGDGSHIFSGNFHGPVSVKPPIPPGFSFNATDCDFIDFNTFVSAPEGANLNVAAVRSTFKGGKIVEIRERKGKLK